MPGRGRSAAGHLRVPGKGGTRMVVLAVVVWAIVAFWSPVIVAVIRQPEPIGLVILLTFLCWPAAWIAVFWLPRRGRPVRTATAGRVPYPGAAAGRPAGRR